MEPKDFDPEDDFDGPEVQADLDPSNPLSEDFDFDSAEDEEIVPEDSAVSFVTGRAGTGKSFLARKLQEVFPRRYILCATTGIAAINLGGTTINSVLGYFDTAALKDAFTRGGVQARLRKLRDEGVRTIILDEVSMLAGEQLELIVDSFNEVNRAGTDDEVDLDDRMNLMLVGDFAQLPPVKAKFAFESTHWEEFEENTRKLSKIYRQDNLDFITALNHARLGHGGDAADIMEDLIGFERGIDSDFDGPTIMAKNDEVDRHNHIRMAVLKTTPKVFLSTRGGRQRGEWKQIPERLIIKPGAPVMILNNAKDPHTKEWIYVNGDLGHLLEDDSEQSALVELVRGGVVRVPYVRRTCSTNPKREAFRLQRQFKLLTSAEIDEGLEISDLDEAALRERLGDRYTEFLEVLQGWIQYMPLRVAYASTVHKAQGLSLDRAQISLSNHFFSNPGSVYVALSRARTPEGLRLVGTKDLLAKRCTVDSKVKRFL